MLGRENSGSDANTKIRGSYAVSCPNLQMFMRVFVTGGVGHLGSHVCVVLLPASREVVVREKSSNS